jgi:glutathione synthase/RimK-type ligase-like ATP-grasp enzyme
MILIVTISDDLHALAVQRSVRASGYEECLIVECDRIAQRDVLSYGVNFDMHDRILTSCGRIVSLSDAKVLWMRTIAWHQILRLEVEDEKTRTVINNDTRGGLMGYLTTHFDGKWISAPEATYRASDKIVQLKAALDSGFRVPRTLVSQSREDVLDFFAACGGQVIVKTLVGAPGPFLETRKLKNPHSFDDTSFTAAPSIFQEYIPGNRHLRLNCFGQNSYAALIQSDDLDWRSNLNVPITEYLVESSLHNRVRAVLDRLGLAMGIVDLKLTPEGEPVWLEVNPQGQFLFLDAFTDLGLAQRFASYLLAEHQTVM